MHHLGKRGNNSQRSADIGSLIAEAAAITHVLEPTYGQAESQRDTQQLCYAMPNQETRARRKASGVSVARPRILDEERLAFWRTVVCDKPRPPKRRVRWCESVEEHIRPSSFDISIVKLRHALWSHSANIKKFDARMLLARAHESASRANMYLTHPESEAKTRQRVHESFAFTSGTCRTCTESRRQLLCDTRTLWIVKLERESSCECLVD